MQRETVKDDAPLLEADAQAAPGVVIVFSGTSPCFHVLALQDGTLDIGRDDLAELGITDGRVSREHFRVQLANNVWSLTDRKSTNGSFLDGEALKGTVSRSNPRVIRMGKTLLVPVADITPFALHGLVVDSDRVVGPGLRVVLDHVAAIRRSGQNVMITGASGSGKELAARAYHDAAPGSSGGERPFVAVNCATIPEGLAERILFGAKKGAYSGADADAKGLVQAAHGGTLFLDEIGDIEGSVQTKLLRVLESKEVLPVGALQPVMVELSFCAATHKDLRVEVMAGRFREDLYFRMGRPEVHLPALSERPEEIPWLLAKAITAVHPNAGADCELVETCLLRPWPGNVRELLAEVRGAAIAAAGEKLVLARHLAKNAGLSWTASTQSEVLDDENEEDHPIMNALRETGGNVLQASSLLGMTRAKVRRFIEKKGLDVATLRKK